VADGSLVALAGLWESWRAPAREWVRSFAIITTTPNELCAELHNRIPVVLKPETWPGLTWRGARRCIRAESFARAVSIGRDDLLAGERTGRERQE